MRNIVVYVEVRSGEDNRSAGVRKVIEALGARVNLSLLRLVVAMIYKTYNNYDFIYLPSVIRPM